MSQLPADLPEETVELYSKALSQTPMPRDHLKEKVQRQLRVLKIRSRNNDQVDFTLAEEIANGLVKLIDDVSDADFPHVQAACTYFTSNDDALPDLESIAGFDDDAQVFNAVCAHLNRKDLEVV